MGRGKISVSKEDEAYIKLNYRTGNTNEIAKHVGLTRKQVNYIASRLGETKELSSYDIFNDAVMDELRKKYPFTLDSRKLAEQLGLSYDSMVCICNRNGLHKDSRTKSAIIINNMYNWGYETVEEVEQAYGKMCSVIRAEYRTTPNVHELADRLGISVKNMRSIANRLGVKRRKYERRDSVMIGRCETTNKKVRVAPKKQDINQNVIETIQREYADETDNEVMAERLGITRAKLVHMANKIGIQKSEEAVKVIRKKAGIKGYGCTFEQFSELVEKIEANYPTCNNPKELAKELGISCSRMRRIANTRGITRETRSTAWCNNNVTKPKPKPISKEARNEQLRRTPEAQDIIRKSGFPQLGTEVLKVRLRGRLSVQGDFTPDRDLLRVLRREKVDIENGDCIGKACYCASYCGGPFGKFPKHCITK